MEDKRRLTSTVTIYRDDIQRIHNLKQDKANRRRREHHIETNASVVSKALDALERERDQKDSPDSQ